MGCAPTSHLHRIGSCPGRSWQGRLLMHTGECSASVLDAAQVHLLQCCCAASSYIACAPTAAPRKANAVCSCGLKLAHPLSWPGLLFCWAGVPRT